MRHRRPRSSAAGWPIALLLVAYPALSGSQRGALVPFLKLSDLVLVALTIAVVVRWGGRWHAIERAGLWVGIYATATAIFTIVNIARRGDLTWDQNWSDIATAAQYFLYFYCAFVYAQKGRLRTWLIATVAMAAFVGLVAVLQFLGLWQIREFVAQYTGNKLLAGLIWNGTYRSTGLFPSWHTLEMYLAIALVLTIGVLARERLSLAQRLVALVAAGLMLVGMVCGLTLTPALLVVAALLYFARNGRIGRYLPLVGAIIAVTLLTTPLLSMIDDRLSAQAITVADMPPWLPQTIAYRLYQWQSSLFPVIRQNLWTGYGPINESINTGIFQFTESQYVNVLVLGGIPLFVVFIVMMWRLIAVAHGAVRRVAPDGIDGVVVASGFLVATGVTVLQVVHPYLQDSAGAGMFFGLLGMTAGVTVRTSALVPRTDVATESATEGSSPATLRAGVEGPVDPADLTSPVGLPRPRGRVT